ncbi:hypothetical protein LJK87_21295 [Paenibacillus sp. P25]|nr:hypothetical protein LJK87_21295 [Paenibacillus sp. P25]
MVQHRPFEMRKSFVHPLYELNESVQKLEEEHAFLEERLAEICRLAGTVDADAMEAARSGAWKN